MSVFVADFYQSGLDKYFGVFMQVFNMPEQGVPSGSIAYSPFLDGLLTPTIGGIFLRPFRLPVYLPEKFGRDVVRAEQLFPFVPSG